MAGEFFLQYYRYIHDMKANLPLSNQRSPTNFLPQPMPPPPPPSFPPHTHTFPIQDATTHSVATRRTKLAKAEREIAKRQKAGKHIRSEIKARRDQLLKIRDRTKKSRKAIAEQQRLKALWFQYGSRKKYEEHLAWEEEKEALRQAIAEKYERDRLAKLAREKRRAEEREKRARLRNIATLEIQRLMRGRRGRARAKRRRLWLAKQARTQEELEQCAFRGCTGQRGTDGLLQVVDLKDEQPYDCNLWRAVVPTARPGYLCYAPKRGRKH
jgi:hypothetical protein